MELVVMVTLALIFPVLYSKEFKPITYTFELNKTLGINLENACINTNTGKLYVGARNLLYQLGRDLEIEVEVDLKPEIDKIDCHIYNFCDYPINQTDVYSKVIIIDDSDNMLIHCTTAHNGICLKRDMNNIRKPVKQFYIPVVGNTEQASTFAFIAPGPVTGENDKVIPILNIGVEPTTKNMFHKAIPTFASRSLYNFEPVISLSSFVFEGRSVYGFSSEGYSYMISVQKQGGNFQSQIFRVCQDDQDFDSYSNILLQCWQNGTSYNLAQTGYLGKAGTWLAKAMNISSTDDVLYVSFSKEDPGSSPTEQSALCIYPMKSVRRTFENNIQGCVKGGDGKPVNCSEIKVRYDYCHNEERLVLQRGTIPVVGEAAVTFNSLLTSLLVDIISNYTIAHVGNNKGHIIKVTLETKTSAKIFEDVDYGEGNAIKPSMFFDAEHEYIYAMTDYKVLKIKLYDCCEFTSCQACYGARRPYCGWCTLENRCSLHKDCIHMDEIGWVHSSGSSCPNETEDSREILQDPVLTSIEPTVGPQAGGTSVTIVGQNFNFGIYTPITIGGFCCHPMNTSHPSRNTDLHDSIHLNHTKQRYDDSDMLVCKTQIAYKSLINKPLNVNIGGATITDDKNLTFTYVEDPKVTSIEPRSSFQSGGRILKVKGSNLFTIQKPTMYILFDGVKSNSEICRWDQPSDSLLCPTPRLNTAGKSNKNVNSRHTVYHHINLGFEMDDVATVTADNLPLDVRSIVYFTDPVLENLTTIVKISEVKDSIVIKGEHLTLAATKSDVRVSIGCKMCTVVTLTTTNIVCKPPADKPICGGNKDQQFSVNVSIGNFRQHIGYVKYVTNTIHRKVNLLAIMVTVAIAVCLLVAVTTIIYCKCRHKKKAVLNMIMFKNDSDGEAEKVELIQEEIMSQSDDG